LRILSRHSYADFVGGVGKVFGGDEAGDGGFLEEFAGAVDVGAFQAD